MGCETLRRIAAGLLLAMSASGAAAEDAPGGGRKATEPSVTAGTGTASRLPGGGTTRDLTKPGNGGVAGTGLGGSTGALGRPGLGQSVKGPPGQGIDGQAVEGRGIGVDEPSKGAGAGGTGGSGGVTGVDGP